jgi:prepilin-type N-terminal cleavage/methylation domain-containing protein
LSNRQRGHTLIELLIAIIVAGLVVSMASAVMLWAYRQSHGSLGTTDRLERHQSLRQELFQLGRQTRTLQLQPDHWTLFRRTQEKEDTIHVRCHDTALVRDGKSLSRGDSVLSCRFLPVFPHSLSDRDGWMDVVGSTLEPPGTDTLVFVRLLLVVQAPQVRGAPTVSADTIDLRIPL